MTPELVLTLLGLALLDSTSIGTLLVPLWLLVTPGRVRAVPLTAYLLTIATFYWVVGVVVFRGFSMLQGVTAADSAVSLWVQLVVGVGLFLLSFRFNPKRHDGAEPGRLVRWRGRIASGEASASAVVGLALAAGALEVATMLPYLGALGILTAADPPAPLALLVLGAYCAVMIAPALVVLAARLALGRMLEPRLAAAERWLSRHATSSTGWILAIVGFLVARDAAWRLGLLDRWIS